MKKIWLALLLIAASAVTADAAAKFTYVDLVNKLTDMQGLSVLPVPGEKCQQWSSYDRASRYDEATGKYVAWDANGDGGGIIRREGDVSVVAEMEGPGVIWRIWSALADKGHVKIYLDGAAAPTIDLPFIGYFDGKNSPFDYPALVHNSGGGQNCYVPIPFQKSCKITMDKGWGSYYQFVYTTYPKDTVIPTFTPNLGVKEKAALARVDKFLTYDLGSDPAGKRQGEKSVSKTLSVPAGKSTTVATLKGKSAITAINVKFDPAAMSDAYKTLREVVLKISWDGEKTPSVWVPLGDFFGTAPGVNKHTSLPLGMSTDGDCYSYWYMPFTNGAKVEIQNDGKKPFPMQMSITTAPLTGATDQLGRFHAKWHRDAFLPAEKERAIDWTMLKTQGQGRFCGVMLHVWNPRGGWWGEGDEKFFVDGEKFPSTIGTGSEDYFGYAWCNPQLFQNAFHNQTISQGNAGNVSVNRWQIADNVPFQKSFEGDIEKYFPNTNPTLYAATVIWYQAPGQADPYQPVTSIEDRNGYYGIPVSVRIPGAREAETLKVVGTAPGQVRTQDLFGIKLSEDRQLWWTGAKPGDKLVLALPVKKSGSFDLEAQFVKAVDYGIVQLYLDDAKLGGPIDLYNDGVVSTGPVDLGTQTLTEGDHKLTIEIVGANDKAAKAYLVGLDYIKLKPTK